MKFEFETITYLGACYDDNTLKENLNKLGDEGFGVVGVLFDKTNGNNLIILQKQIA